MASSSSMYSLPPVVSLRTIDSADMPTSMYTLKPILDFQTQGSTAPSLAELEQRQQTILDNLNRLKDTVSSLRTKLNLKDDSSDSDSDFERRPRLLAKVGALKETLALIAKTFSDDNAESIQEKSRSFPNVSSASSCVAISIRASPAHPPLSVRGLVRDLARSGQLAVRASTHVHSSLTGAVPPALRDFITDESCGAEQNSSADKPILRIVLVWKNVDRDPECTIGSRVVRGEVSIVRFLERKFSNVFISGQDDAKLEALYDDVHSKVVWGSATTRQDVIDQLSEQLAKSLSISGNDVGPVDLYVWSSLANSGGFDKIGSEKVKTWAAKCLGRCGMPSLPKLDYDDDIEIIGEAHSSIKSNDSKSRLFELFDKLKIAYDNIEHPEVFTVEAMMPHLKHVDGAVSKNLFLKDRQKKLYLLSALHDRNVNLSEIGKKAGAKDLRFGDESVMLEKLGVRQGCVTAYALANDLNKEVTFLVDEALVDGSYKKVYFHPMVNSASTGISPMDFKRFLEHTGHKVVTVKF